MRLLITDMEGGLGWSLALCVSARRHFVAAAVVPFRRRQVEEMAATTSIHFMKGRLMALQERLGGVLSFRDSANQLTAKGGARHRLN